MNSRCVSPEPPNSTPPSEAAPILENSDSAWKVGHSFSGVDGSPSSPQKEPFSALSALLLLSPALVAFAWLVSKAQWFWSHNVELNFGWAVLGLCIYLLARSWLNRPPPVLRWSLPAVFTAGLGCGVFFLTQLYQAAYGLTAASMSGLGLGFLLVVSANIAYVWGGPGVRHFGFGFAFLLVALPIPSVLSGPLMDLLQNLLAAINVEILQLLGVPAFRSGHLITIPSGTVGIDEACSGIRSLQSSLMLALFFGELHRISTARRVFLVLAGFALAVFFNMIRTFALVGIAFQSGVDGAARWHDSTSVAILVICFFCLWGLGTWLRDLRLPADESEPRTTP